MFLGTFEHSIDDKNRITVPSRFRERLRDGLVVTIGLDGCLWLFPSDTFETLSAKLSQLPITQGPVREFRRELYANASDDEPDKQGRVNLPDYLLQYANIDNQAVIVGQNDYCEIWNPKAWKERQEQSRSDPQGRANMFATLGI
jgi:MraZ protein